MTPRDPQDTTPSKDSANMTSQKGLLKKRIADLTEADLDALEVPLGTPELPFPMYGTMKETHEGEQRLVQRLSVIAEDENPLLIMSERPFDEAFGILARELPTPSMLPILREMLERLEPQSKNRQFFVMGDPGMGKSFMGGMIGRIMSKDTPRVYDCGGKQMNAMLFEMVLDFGAGDGLAEQIEKRMAAGTLSAASLAVLENLANDVNNDKDTFITKLSEGIFEIDWDGIGRGSKVGNAKMDTVLDAFNRIATLEGFDKGGSNMLGMNSQFGPMITDFIEGNFATYDEYNKSKQGGDDALQTVLQFINGEIDECVVENPLKGKDGVSGPTHFTFKREDVKAGWGILFTGNKSKDGSTTRALNKSVYSRLGPRDLPDVSKRDWQHRICQLMTGVPVSTWYDVYKESADQNPEAFADFLWGIRTAGLSQEKIDQIPNQQRIWLRNWQRVVSASEKLGTFFYGWRDRLDEDRAMDVYDLDDEVDNDFSAEQALDFRRVIKVLQKAEKPRAKLKPSTFKTTIPSLSVFKNPPVRQRDLDSGVENEEGYGTRLTEILINDIFESSGAIGRPRLYKSLMQLAEECSLVEMQLKDAARSGVKTVENELNISQFDSADIRVQAQLAQATFCAIVRDAFPEMTASNDEIVTLDRMVDLISEMRDSKDEARETNTLAIPNLDVKSLLQSPFTNAKMFDCAAESFLQNAYDDLYYDDILTHEELLQSFVLPGLKERNLNAIWESNTSLSSKVQMIDESITEFSDQVTKMKADIKGYKKREKSLQTEIDDLSKIDPSSHKITDINTELSALTDEIEGMEKKIVKVKAHLKEKETLRQNIIEKGSMALDGVQGLNVTASDDEVLNIAENRSKLGIAFTSVACRDENAADGVESYTSVHVLRNEATDKTIIMAEAVSPSLKRAFARAKVKFIDVSEKGAVEKINASVAELTRGQDQDTMSATLQFIFNMRNANDNDNLKLGDDLGSLIVNNSRWEQSEDNKRTVKYFLKPYIG